MSVRPNGWMKGQAARRVTMAANMRIADQRTVVALPKLPRDKKIPPAIAMTLKLDQYEIFLTMQ